MKICYTHKNISKHKGNSIPRHPNRGKTEEEGEVNTSTYLPGYDDTIAGYSQLDTALVYRKITSIIMPLVYCGKTSWVRVYGVYYLMITPYNGRPLFARVKIFTMQETPCQIGVLSHSIGGLLCYSSMGGHFSNDAQTVYRRLVGPPSNEMLESPDGREPLGTVRASQAYTVEASHAIAHPSHVTAHPLIRKHESVFTSPAAVD